MKKLLLLLCLFSATLSMAQQPDNEKRAEKIQALKIAFISQKLDLTTDEAQKFWPVYNNYETELRQVYRDSKNEGVLENDEKLLNVRKRFQPEFTRILGQPRVNKLYGAEREFRGVLMRQIKHDNPHQKPPMRRPKNN